MSLIELKNYLMQNKLVSLSSLTQHFHVDPNLMRDMLAHWQRKGCLRQLNKTASCGSKCQKCSPLITELYEWTAV